MTEDQKKMLTEKLLKECWHERASNMYHMCHKCGHTLRDILHRTFLAPRDLMDCKEALVREGLWMGFISFSYPKRGEGCRLGRAEDKFGGYMHWHFRATDGERESHFCRLVAEFMEAKSP